MTYRVIGSERGSTLLVVLAAIVILGLSAGVAGNSWKNIIQRDREEELFFRGDQYRRAIASFHDAWGVYPKRLEELLEDRRALYLRRHLRRLYSDPMTGAPFALVVDSAGRIRGVYSTDDGRPFRREGFPPEYKDFAKATSYRDWKFVFEPGQKGDKVPSESDAAD
ncbi:MAG: hypothetical protein PWP34_671 [Desulfuromonadales bacterium]|mgnify:CR=1 FL=1|jgi:type II secretory pathway pseudopilin PulG|nr:hypothetical protein [Desulfuromonadales bacterium]